MLPPPAGAGIGVTPPVGAGAEVLKVGESPAGAVVLSPLSPPAEVAGAGVGAGGSMYPPAVVDAEVAPPGPGITGGLPLPSPPANDDVAAGAGVEAPSADAVPGAASVVDLALAVKANALVGCASSRIA